MSVELLEVVDVFAAVAVPVRDVLGQRPVPVDQLFPQARPPRVIIGQFLVLDEQRRQVLLAIASPRLFDSLGRRRHRTPSAR